MKKIIWLFLFIPFVNFVNSQFYNVQKLGNYSRDKIFNASCDELDYHQIYDGDYGIYHDLFVNNSNNPLYLWEFRALTKGDYLYSINSEYEDNKGILIFNKPLLRSKGRAIEPNERVLHLTTAEQVDGASFDGKAWNFRQSVNMNGYNYKHPNYRIEGHPDKISKGSEFDSEIRTLTLYDEDNNINTVDDNRAVLECMRLQIRWCGDGVLQSEYDEQCDPNDSSKEGWGDNGCSSTCEPLEKEVDDYSCDSIAPQTKSIDEGDEIDFRCEGTNSDEYRLKVNGSIINTNGNGNFNYRFDSKGDYNTQCEVNNDDEGWETSNACRGEITVDDGDGPGPGPGYSCDSIAPQTKSIDEGDEIDFRCEGTNSDEYRLKVNGSIINTNGNGNFNYRFDSKGDYNTKCEVNNNDEGWETSNACKGEITVDDNNGGGGGGSSQCGSLDGRSYDENDTSWEGYDFEDLCEEGDSVMTNYPRKIEDLKNYINNFDTWKNDGYPDLSRMCEESGSTRLASCGVSGDTDSGGGVSINGGGGRTPQLDEFDVPDALWVDPPTIQMGEYLPVFWKMDSSINMVNSSKKCSNGEEGKIIHNSIECNFEIFSARGDENNRSARFTRNCFDKQNSNLFGAFSNYMSSNYDNLGAIMESRSGDYLYKLDENNFSSNGHADLGAYQIVLDSIDYKVCNDNGETLQKTNSSSKYLMNFAVGDSYIMQKTPLSISSNTDMSNFWRWGVDGPEQVIDSDTQDEIENINLENYSLDEDIIDGVIQRTDRIAVQSINVNDLDMNISADIDVRKVPTKNIAFIEGSNDNSIELSDVDLDSSWTFIFSGFNNVTFNGNVQGNGVGMYILKDGNIKFDHIDKDAPQKIKGIYVVNETGKINATKMSNDNKNANVWYSDGRLQLEGLFIGDASEVYKNRRSVLENFWRSNYHKESIYNGASFFIKPDVNSWTDLPPGANYFMKSLNVDRK